jgi:purine catabolism regulator
VRSSDGPNVPTSGSSPLPTVRAVLELPVVRRAVPEVVSGLGELDRPVRWVHSGEVPHIARMLKGGELLLTTGMGIGRAEVDQRRYIVDLAERHCAALAIELGTTLRRIPLRLTNEADRRGLPLIVFHREVRFVEITEAVHREIFSRQLELTRRGEALNNRLMGLMLGGARIPELLAALAHVVANPVVLDRTGVGMIYHATHEAGDGEVIAAWDRFARGLPGAPEVAEHPVPAGGAEEWGRVVVLAIDGPLDEHDRAATERAAGLLALALLRDREDESVAMRERGNFLAGMIEGDVDEAEVRTRAAAMGFGRDVREMLPVAVARSPLAAMSTTEETSLARVWSEVQRELAARRVRVITGTREHGRQFLMVLALRRADARDEIANQVSSLVHEETQRHLGSDVDVLVSVGPVARSWSAAGEGLKVALGALAAAPRDKSRTWHDVTRPELDRFLFALRDRPELRHFAETRLAPLIEYHGLRKSKLLPTLVAYCDHCGRKAETARALNIKRQTLYNRLERIEELLGAKLSDGETFLGLHFALRVMRYLDDDTWEERE